MAKKEKETEMTVAEAAEPTKQVDKVETPHSDAVELKVSSLKTDVVLSSELSELKKELAEVKNQLEKLKRENASLKKGNIVVGSIICFDNRNYKVILGDTVKETVDHARKSFVNEDDFAVVLRELK